MVSFYDLANLMNQKQVSDERRFDDEVKKRNYEIDILQNEIDGYNYMTISVITMSAIYLCWRYF
jgi:hypothetical protein